MATAHTLRVNGVGVGHRCYEGFLVDRPHGSSDYLFLHFLTPVRIRGLTSLDQVVEPGTCLIYRPKQPQWYRGEGCGLANDWLHFTGGVAAPVRRLRLPIGVPFRPAHQKDVPVVLSDIHWEWVRRDKHWEEMCDALVRRLVLVVSRDIAAGADPSLTPHLRTLRESCQQLRLRIQASPQDRWTVERMAQSVHLSRSRFTTLFQRFFGVSPIEYLLATRIDLARWHLANSSLPVKRVALLSGFKSVHYFSRAFHQRVGCPPTRMQNR